MIEGGSCGLIAISDEWFSPGTLAHEWRHHLQWHKGFHFDHNIVDFDDHDTYWARIADYFGTSRTEQDALLFELEAYQTELSGMWYEETLKRYHRIRPLW